jgi:predicted nucleic acid-binding protein
MQGDVLTPTGAWRAYDSFRADSRILFLSESSDFSDRWRRAEAEVSSGPNTWTDAYLAVFAEHVNATVVTFDRGFRPIHGCNVTVL